jgi:hypothetical protein
MVSLMLSFAAASTACAAASALPATPLVWLRPAELPPPGSSVHIWPNAATGSHIVGATLDKTNCSLGGEICSSAPVVGELSSGDRVVNFTSPGLFGLGNNLIIAGDYSAPNASYSVFFASATVPGITGQRILGECSAQTSYLAVRAHLTVVLFRSLCSKPRRKLAHWFMVVPHR